MGSEMCIRDRNWHDSADLDLVLCSIFQSTSPAPSAKGSGQGRAGMQDYTALHHFLPASLWNVLGDAETSMEPKLTLLQQHAGNLVLAWPSEKTSLHVTDLLRFVPVWGNPGACDAA